jgi:hypothetical protein
LVHHKGEEHTPLSQELLPNTPSKDLITPLLSKSQDGSRFLFHHKGEEHTLLPPQNSYNKVLSAYEMKQLVYAALNKESN